MPYKTNTIFITHVTQSDFHRNEAARTSDYYLHPNEKGNWSSERLSDLLRLPQLISRKARCTIGFSIFGSNPSSWVWKTRRFMIWLWLLVSLSYTLARYLVLQSFFCLFAAAVSLTEMSFKSMYAFLHNSSHALYLHCVSQAGWKFSYVTHNPLDTHTSLLMLATWCWQNNHDFFDSASSLRALMPVLLILLV